MMKEQGKVNARIARRIRKKRYINPTLTAIVGEIWLDGHWRPKIGVFYQD